MEINRRKLFKAAATGAVFGSVAKFNFTFAKASETIKLPKPRREAPRVVIVGGGWSGSTLAKYIKN